MDGIKKFFSMGKKNTSQKPSNGGGSSHGSTKPLLGSNKPKLSHQDSSTKTPPSKQNSSNHLSKALSRQLSHSDSFYAREDLFEKKPNYKPPEDRGQWPPANSHDRWNHLPSGGGKGSGTGTAILNGIIRGVTLGAMGYSGSHYVSYSGGKMHTGTVYHHSSGAGSAAAASCLTALVGACFGG